MRFLISFAYDGSKYKGFQKQPKKKTIQGEIEKVLKEINNGNAVQIHGSGRTDAAVHALGQKAHFDFDIDMTPEQLKKAMNSLLPADIYVREASIVSDMFHARYQVKAKEYIYKINMGQYNPLEKDYVYQYNKRLDVVAMERAMKYLEGEHDFKSFSKANEEKDDFVRKVIQANLVRDLKSGNIIVLSFLGTGFLRYMVRNMVGTLIEVGEGKRKAEDIIDILNAKDRRKAGVTAHPEGLYLKDVFY